ncbi:porin, partial [Salmonella enterica]|uniref:porin n=1 Tax=Salmonella enterica TaxID=28901 RepID=UPI00398C5E38
EKKNAGTTQGQFGLKGETQINTVVTGFGQWEYRTKAGGDEGEQQNWNLVRLAFAGLKYAEVGSIEYGRNYGIVYDVDSYTDMAPYFSGETWGGAYTDNYMPRLAAGLLTYRNPNFCGRGDGSSFCF